MVRAPPEPPAPSGYVVLWAEKRLAWLRKLGGLGGPFEVLYGSPHGSAPSLVRYGIGHGDRLFVVSLARGAVWVEARFVVDRIVPAEVYLRDHLRLGEDDLRLHLWDLEEKLARERPDLGHRLPFGCVDEAALPREATQLGLHLEIPSVTIEAIRFQPKRGEAYGLPLVEGKLKKSSALQGHFYRLTPEALVRLDALVDRAAPRRSVDRSNSDL